jgi:hypothetical protein
MSYQHESRASSRGTNRNTSGLPDGPGWPFILFVLIVSFLIVKCIRA